MRRSKRRKVKREEEKTDPLTKLRKDVLDSLDTRRACDVFLGSWKLSVQSEWLRKSHEERAMKVIELCKSRGNNLLRRVIRKTGLTTLRRIYQEYYKTSKKMTRDVIEKEVIDLFLGKETALQKRKNEKSNLAEIENLDEEIRFITLCEITVPNEMIRHIFSFFKISVINIVNIGGACKFFYLTLLCCSNDAKVTKKNIFKVPLLVLKSLKTVSVEGGYHYKTGDMKRSDLSYLWGKLNPDRLRTLGIYSDDETILKSLKTYQRKCKKEGKRYTLENVTKIVFHKTGHWYSEFDSVFPKLRTIENLASFHASPCPYLEACSFEFYEMPEESVIGIYDNLRSVELKKMRTSYFLMSGCKFHSTILSFPNVEVLKINLQHYRVSVNDCEFDFSMFSSFLSLKRVEILDHDFMPLYLREDDRKDGKPVCRVVQVRYPNKTLPFRIEELKIKIGIPNLIFCVIDFNLEDMIRQGFISSDIKSQGEASLVKKLEVEVPLMSRSWDMERNKKVTKKLHDFVESTVTTIHQFLIFLEMFMEKQYEVFESEIRTHVEHSWARDEVWSLRYERKWKRLKLKYRMFSCWITGGSELSRSGVFSLEADRMEGKEKEAEEMKKYLENTKLPGCLLLGYFVTNVMHKLDVNVISIDISPSMNGESDERYLKEVVVEYVKDQLKMGKYDDFVFDEQAMCVTRKSVL